MSTYNKTIVAYCSTIIAALALYYVAFGPLSDKLVSELNVKDLFAYLVSDATTLICLTVIACAVGYCCSEITNHMVCVRNNERRIRAERAEVDAQVGKALKAIAEADEAIRKETERRASEPFPKRGSEAWTVGNEPVRYLVGTGRMSPQQFREQYMTDFSSASDCRLTYFQIADLVMWWLNLNTGYASRNDVLCAIRSLVAYGMITTREGDWFISSHRSICNLKPHD